MAQNSANATPASRGRFITFEGGEGAGKSTQVGHLVRRLEQAGIGVVVTREPGGTPFAEAARALLLDSARSPSRPLAQALLFNAARTEHLDLVIRPALARGAWVICDRFADSTRAYQGAAGGADPDELVALERIVVGATRPNLTVLLDLDARVGLTRANRRRAAATPGAFVAADTFEGRNIAFHERLRDGFLAIARADPDRVGVVDAFRNELAIADDVWQLVAARFALPASL